jgi:hypothetical protein
MGATLSSAGTPGNRNRPGYRVRPTIHQSSRISATGKSSGDAATGDMESEAPQPNRPGTSWVLRAVEPAKSAVAIGAFQAQPTVAAAANESGETEHPQPPGIAEQAAKDAPHTETEPASEPRSEALKTPQQCGSPHSDFCWASSAPTGKPVL